MSYSSNLFGCARADKAITGKNSCHNGVYIPVPRPWSGQSMPWSMGSPSNQRPGDSHVTPLARWESETCDQAPYNNIGAVKARAQNDSSTKKKPSTVETVNGSGTVKHQVN